jgi:hypothetical protein
LIQTNFAQKEIDLSQPSVGKGFMNDKKSSIIIPPTQIAKSTLPLLPRIQIHENVNSNVDSLSAAESK